MPDPASPELASPPAAAPRTRLQQLRNAGRPQLPISRPPARPRLSLPHDGLFSPASRRRRLLRGGDRPLRGNAADEDGDWSSDSDSIRTPSPSTHLAADSDSSGSDTVGAVVRRARSTRIARGVGTLRVVSSPGPARRRFPSVASSLGLSPVRRNAPTPVSSPVRGRIPSSSPFGGRSRLPSGGASVGLAATTATNSSAVEAVGANPDPNFSPPLAASEDTDSSFFSEQDTISFIYDTAVVSDAFSKAVLAPPGPSSSSPAPTRLSPFAEPFFFSGIDGEERAPPTMAVRSRLPADKFKSYAALGVVPFVDGTAFARRRARIDAVKRLQSSGIGGEPIPVMVGPESLPYARNPSGVDGSVLDSTGRLNVWMRSSEDPEPEHVDYLHFQRRPGALNPATRVLADDDLLNSAYSRPSDYVVRSADPKPMFKAARPRRAEDMPPDIAASPFSLAPSPIPLHYPPSSTTAHPHPSLYEIESAHATSWLAPPMAICGRSPTPEEIALQLLIEKLQASNELFNQPFGRPTVGGVWSPDMAFPTPSASAFSSSPPSSMGATGSPFSSQPSHQSSPAQHLLPGVYSSTGGLQAPQDLLASATIPIQPQIDDAVFRSRLAGYARPFHDPSFGHPSLPAPWSVSDQAGPPPPTTLPALPPGLQATAPLITTLPAATGLLPAVEIASRTGPSQQIGRRDDDPVSLDDGRAQLYPPDSATPAVVRPPVIGSSRPLVLDASSPLPLERCDDAIFLPAGVGRGFANGGARRPGPRVQAAPRSLGRRALASMEVAAGRERQSSVLEKERQAVLASREAEALALPAPVVVVGELRALVSLDRPSRGCDPTAEERSRTTNKPKRSARASLPAVSVMRNDKTKAVGANVLDVSSLTAMFCDNATPSPSAVAALRRSEQRRIVSEPVRRSHSKPSQSLGEKAPSTQRSIQRARSPAPASLTSAVKKASPSGTSTSAASASHSSGRPPLARGKRQRGGRSRAPPSNKSIRPSA